MDNNIIVQAEAWGLLKRLNRSTFCMTGTLSAKRLEIEQLILALGGQTHDGIRSGTQYLITPNGIDFTKGSKYKTAVSKGVEVITESEFCAMIVPSIDELLGGNNEPGREA